MAEAPPNWCLQLNPSPPSNEAYDDTPIASRNRFPRCFSRAPSSLISALASWRSSHQLATSEGREMIRPSSLGCSSFSTFSVASLPSTGGGTRGTTFWVQKSWTRFSSASMN